MRWDEAKQGFRELMRRLTVREISRRIPTARTTIYRLYNGETKQPYQRVHKGIERLIEEQKREQHDG